MALTPEQKDVIKIMNSIVQSYHTLSIGSAHGLHRLARDYFSTEIDIKPTMEAVRSRRGDMIYLELNRLKGVIKEIERRASESSE